jgi:ABC-type transporter Mla maintaining outer membrane lipid asymmetry ATPase subunit MlaF
MSSLLIEVRDVVKDFRGLRPLRVQQLDLHAHQSIALLGFDHATAEVLVNLLTGAILPDTGSITVFGQRTSAIADAQAWVQTLDQFGLISERAVMLDQLTTEQNLALPLSLRIHSMPDAVRERVRDIASEVGLSSTELESRAAALSPLGRQRLRLGRALALSPSVLLAEHPNAPLSAEDTLAFATVVRQVVDSRRIGSLVLTANHAFAASISSEILTLQPATGILKAASTWRKWFA